MLEMSKDIPHFSGDERTDAVLADFIRNKVKGRYTDISKVIYDAVKRDTGNDKYAKQIAGIGMN